MPLFVSLQLLKHGDCLLLWNPDRVEVQGLVVCSHEKDPGRLVLMIDRRDVNNGCPLGQENYISCRPILNSSGSEQYIEVSLLTLTIYKDKELSQISKLRHSPLALCSYSISDQTPAGLSSFNCVSISFGTPSA